MRGVSPLVDQGVALAAGPVALAATLNVPPAATGVVLFSHGSGSSRHSRRNRFVARVLQEAGLATVLLDLLTPDEEAEDARTGHLRFDVGLLAGRLIAATDWLAQADETAGLRIGYFGASTGAAAALIAAAQRPAAIGAVVSRGGRPDLAEAALARVRAPTLLIVGDRDEPVVRLNQQALRRLGAPTRELAIVPGATHLFEEPGALQEVARLARTWFRQYLMPGRPRASEVSA